MLQDLTLIYERDIDRLYKEIEAFASEEQLWQVSGSISNSAGNLCLHLVGNLKTYIAKNLGTYQYERNRPLEFSLRDIPKTILLEMVLETKTLVLSTLQGLTEADLEKNYPEQVLGNEMRNGFFLVHLIGHLSYHLGQINYLRRILE